MSIPDSCGLIHAFSANDGPYIMLGDGLRHAVDQITDPNNTYPAFVTIIGKNTLSKPPGRHAHPLAVVNSSTLSTHISQPVFLVSIDLEHLYNFSQARKYRHHPRSYRVEWAADSTNQTMHKVVDAILGRLILLFSDVVCICLDDFASPKEALELVTCWTRLITNQNPFWKPTLLLASRKSSAVVENYKLTYFNIIKAVKVCTRRSKLFKKVISQALAPVHKQRVLSRSLFSAQHLVSFFQVALKQFAHNLDSFDLVGATRTHNPIDSSIITHIRIFLELCLRNRVSNEFAFRYVASALVMDSSPPEIHRKYHLRPPNSAKDPGFPGEVVFDSLYACYCFEALAETRFPPADTCQLIRAKFCKFYDLVQPGSASQGHQDTIKSLEVDWSGFKTKRSCIRCLRRKPEHSFRCGHTLCDDCVRMLGSQIEEREYSYVLMTCPICCTSNKLSVDLKPPTAGARLLVLDGGGVRGIFTILAIRALDAIRKLPYPIYDDFDLAMGTSSGKCGRTDQSTR